MKMGTTRLPFRYEAAARHAPQSEYLRQPTILGYASLSAFQTSEGSKAPWRRPLSFLFWSTQLPRIAKPRTKIQTLRVLRRRQNSPDEHDRPSWLALGNRWEDAMDRLSALDASFLYGETPESPMHVAGLAIFERRPLISKCLPPTATISKRGSTSYHSSNASWP
jgi:hypothetical protein